MESIKNLPQETLWKDKKVVARGRCNEGQAREENPQRSDGFPPTDGNPRRSGDFLRLMEKATAVQATFIFRLMEKPHCSGDISSARWESPTVQAIFLRLMGNRPPFRRFPPPDGKPPPFRRFFSV